MDSKGFAVAAIPKLSLIGIVLLVVGFVGPAALATVHIDATAPSYSTYWPDGSSSSPVVVCPGQGGDVKMTVDESLSVHKVNIDKGNDGSVDETISLPYDDYYSGYWSYVETWMFPSSKQTIKFTFIAKDSAGNRTTKTGYAKVGEPSGTLYINGQAVDQGSDITLSTNDLNFKINITNQPDLVNSVTVKVVDKETITLSKQNSTTYTGGTTLSDGTYTIKAYVHDTDGNDWRIASIMAGIGEEPIPSPGTVQDEWFWMKIIGAAMIPLGFFVRF